MKRGLVVFAILSLLTLPTVTPAETQGGPGGQPMMEHQGGQHMMDQKEPGMEMKTKTILVGEKTVEGVKATLYLNDVGAMMAQMGMKENYHFMMKFKNMTTDAAVDEGTVAVKITDPKTGKAGDAIPLIGMIDHFGIDVLLPAKGKYTFEVGTKLADGKTRQFSFQYTIQ